MPDSGFAWLKPNIQHRRRVFEPGHLRESLREGRRHHLEQPAGEEDAPAR